MAGQQGTGKHPHKSAADPKEHHEAASTKGESKSNGSQTAGKHESSSRKEESGGQGTGKHPHKSAADPKEHHEGAKK